MDTEEFIDKIEAEAKLIDAELSELTLVPESEVEELRERVDSLESENAELQEDVEELEADVSDKDETIESYEAEIDVVTSAYAESLSATKGLDEDILKERFTVEELREMHDEAVEEAEVEELGGTPDPSSADPGEGEQEAAVEEEELSEDELVRREAAEAAVEAFEGAGGAWAAVADDIRETELSD